MICTGKIFSFWGSSKGLLRYLAPQTRLFCGWVVLISCIISSLHNYYQLILVLGVTVYWCILAGMKIKIFLKLLLICIFLFSPIFLFTPFIDISSDVNGLLENKFIITGKIVLKSSCSLFISAATISIIDYGEMYEALKGIHMPPLISMIIIQIINQILFMVEETKRVIIVLTLRGNSPQKRLKLIFSFPIVWITRILFRAQQLSRVMSIRGYDENFLKLTKQEYLLNRIDWVIISFSIIYFIFSIFLQLKEKI